MIEKRMTLINFVESADNEKSDKVVQFYVKIYKNDMLIQKTHIFKYSCRENLRTYADAIVDTWSLVWNKALKSNVIEIIAKLGE